MFWRPGSTLYFRFRGVSPPIASTAMVTMDMTIPALLFRDLDYFASFIAAAMRTDAVRNFGLVAIGAFGAAGDFRMVVSPACEVRSWECRLLDLASCLLLELPLT